MIVPHVVRHISTHILTKRMTCNQGKAPGFSYFNSHPHEEDDMIMIFVKGKSKFQLTSSRRGWHGQHIECANEVREFQLTSSRRGWLPKLKKYFYLPYFNSHPHEEDDILSSVPMRCTCHFNSHPHEEDDILNIPQATYSNISTHILTKRMTFLFSSFLSL